MSIGLLDNREEEKVGHVIYNAVDNAVTIEMQNRV